MEFVKTLIQNEPVMTRLVVAVLGIAAAYGLPIPEGAASLVAELLAAGLTIWMAASARKSVTPVANPHDKEGNLLVPAVAPTDPPEGH